VFGIVRGGDPRQALTQINALLRMFALFFAIDAAFRGREDLKRLALLIAAAALYRALACLWFFWFYVRAGAIVPYPETLTDHHDSTLWVSACLGAVAWMVSARRGSSRMLVLPPLLLWLLAMEYNDRRIAWVELMGGLALLFLAMTLGQLRRRTKRRLLVAAPIVLVYVAVGWGRSERVFAPVEQLRSALTDSTDASNDARKLENRGLVVTLQTRRLLGSGFGHEFIEVSTLYSLGMQAVFPNYRFLPHNSLLGLLAFTGTVGFSIIWLFAPVSAYLAARSYPRARDSLEQALSLVSYAVPFVYAAQAFGDMGIQSLKANVLLAVSVTLSARLAVATGAWPLRGAARRRAAAPVPAAAPEPLVETSSVAR
jgi:hypothetical protein